MTINEILTEAFEKIKQEHNTIITDVSFDVIRTLTNDYIIDEIEVRGKVL